MDPLCLSFPARGHSLQDASITEPRTWANLVGKAPRWPPHRFLLFTGSSSSPPTKAVFEGAAFVEGIDEMYSLLTPDSIMPCGFPLFPLSWFFLFYFFFWRLPILIRVLFLLSVCVWRLLSLPPLFRLQCSQDTPGHLADEHALIARYVARLQHCARSVVEQQQAGGQGLIRGGESSVTRGCQLENTPHVGFFLRSYQLCLAEFK